MMAKPMKTLELHYPMIQFLRKLNSTRYGVYHLLISKQPIKVLSSRKK